MAALPIIYREPATIAQGTTVSFTRNLKDYQASLGWSLLYSLRGGAQPIEFASVANGNLHQITVLAVVTQTWMPGEYTLFGKAINVDGTAEQFYIAPCSIVPDGSVIAGDAVIVTHAQRMLVKIEQQLELLASNALQTTNVEGTEIIRVQRMELFNLRAKYIRERQGEEAQERAKAGLPNRRKIFSRLNITTPGTAGIAPTGAVPDNPFNYWP
jgi:hypothetical protein